MEGNGARWKAPNPFPSTEREFKAANDSRFSVEVSVSGYTLIVSYILWPHSFPYHTGDTTRF